MPPVEVNEARFEEYRLKSFRTPFRRNRKANRPWPHETPTPASLARAGFYYTPTGIEKDQTTCFSCGLKLSQWELNDNPFLEHLRERPECEWAQLTARSGCQDYSDLELDLWPLHSERAIEARTNSFNLDWSHSRKYRTKLSVEDLVIAGLYFNPYKNRSDRTFCSSCDFVCEKWGRRLNGPLAEHQSQKPECPFWLQEVSHDADVDTSADTSASIRQDTSQEANESSLTDEAWRGTCLTSETAIVIPELSTNRTPLVQCNQLEPIVVSDTSESLPSVNRNYPFTRSRPFLLHKSKTPFNESTPLATIQNLPISLPPRESVISTPSDPCHEERGTSSQVSVSKDVSECSIPLNTNQKTPETSKDLPISQEKVISTGKSSTPSNDLHTAPEIEDPVEESSEYVSFQKSSSDAFPSRKTSRFAHTQLLSEESDHQSSKAAIESPTRLSNTDILSVAQSTSCLSNASDLLNATECTACLSSTSELLSALESHASLSNTSELLSDIEHQAPAGKEASSPRTPIENIGIDMEFSTGSLVVPKSLKRVSFANNQTLSTRSSSEDKPENSSSECLMKPLAVDKVSVDPLKSYRTPDIDLFPASQGEELRPGDLKRVDLVPSVAPLTMDSRESVKAPSTTFEPAEKFDTRPTSELLRRVCTKTDLPRKEFLRILSTELENAMRTYTDYLENKLVDEQQRILLQTSCLSVSNLEHNNI